MRFGGLGMYLLIGLLCSSCAKKEDKRLAPTARKVHLNIANKIIATSEKKLLSSYGFFKGKLAELNPSEGVYPYTINTPLFSNYAEKARFIYLPNDNKMTFKAQGPLKFTNGAILIKNFYYPTIKSASSQKRQLVETRLLINENGKWKPLNYIWNDEQTEAVLNYVGKKLIIHRQDENNHIQEVNYTIPNLNQCKNCHNTHNKITPIGITAAQLNLRYPFVTEKLNQLDYFKKENKILEFTKAENYPSMPVWNDEHTGSLEERARAYLDANCAHCHSSQGSAKNSGLSLNYHEKDRRKRGVYKPPIAAGKGSGDLKYGIVPGKPEESILIYRVSSNDPAIRMPELGRSVVHKEGLALLQAYIQELAAH